MRSLRSRLVIGSALIAVLPIALVTLVLSQRLQSQVRAQATQRLNDALGGLESELDRDGRRMDVQLGQLAGDPALKRLYLLRPSGSRDLSEVLAGRRALLGLDFLEIADTHGVVVADAAADGISDVRPDSASARASAGGTPGHAVLAMSVNGAPAFALASARQIPYENDWVGSVRGGLWLDAGFLARLKRTGGVDLVLVDRTGRALVSTLPDAGGRSFTLGRSITRVDGPGGRYLARGLALGASAGTAGILGLVSTAASDHAIRTLQISAALLGLLALALAILLGGVWSSQVSRPVERLAAFSQRVAQGEWDEPLELRSVRELETLVAALDRMRADLRSYRTRLVASERQAAWSQMARNVAHEVKNPLTPIAVAVADLKRSFEQKRADFPEILERAVHTVTEEVDTLKRMLQEFTDFARLPAPVKTRCSAADVMNDLEGLYSHDVAAGRLAFARPAAPVTFQADAGLLRRALVNLIKNGLEAVNGNGRVMVSAAADPADVEFAVRDDGPGLSPGQREQLFVPGFTTKPDGSGLGLTLVERVVTDHGGTVTVESEPGRGTRFRLRIPRGPGD